MLVLFNGKVYCSGRFDEAVVIDDQKIQYTGTNDGAFAAAGEEADRIDLGGRLVVPGFIDSHAHGGLMTASFKGKINLFEGDTVEEYLDIIRRYVAEHPDHKVYKGAGWSSPLFGEVGPAKELLDEICSDRPIVLKGAEGHSLWANSRAIELAGVDEHTPNPMGGVIERNPDGSIHGTFKDEAQSIIDAAVEDDPVALYKETILDYQDAMAALGYTAVAELMVKRGSNIHKAAIELAEEGKLKMKYLQEFTVSPLTVDEDLRLLRDRRPGVRNKYIRDQYAKIFIDGVLESQTAWLKQPYSNRPDFCGEPLWTDEKLFETCAEIDRMGYDIHFHVIGDRAVAQMIDAMEYVAKANGPRDRRPVAAHIQIMDPADILRMKEAGFVFDANPYWFFKDEIYSKLNEYPMLGERADHQYPMKSIMDAGIVVGVGSDYPITEVPSPLYCMKTGVQRVAYEAEADDEASLLNPDERVSFDEMFKCVTINSAYAMRIENITGSIEVGKDADLVVLDRNIFGDSHFYEAQVDMTISEGDIIYRR